MDQPSRASSDPLMLPDHLQSMLDLTSKGLDSVQRGQLANTLLQFVDLFPVPGSALTGHTDAVEHTIDTAASTPIRCAPRRMSPQKIKKEEACVTEMLTCGQIKPSDRQSVVGTGGVGDEAGRRNPILCGLSPVELGDGEGCLPPTSDRRYPRHVGQ